MLAEIVALVVAPRCATCAAPAARAGDVICAGCRRGLPWLSGPCCRRCALPLPHARGRCPARDAAFDGAWAAVAYEGVARDAMHALKFRAARPLAGVMAAQIAANAPPALLGITDGTTLVAVPPHPRRRRARGFDPAELIAVALARRTGLALGRALRRGRAPSHQLGASRADRRDPANLHFAARGPAPPRVVLVDDVHTTGATLGACARALREAGSEHVAALTWARTLDERLVESDQTEAYHRGLARPIDREDFDMQIEVKGRNVPVSDELRELVERKFRKVAAQVSDLARMEVELHEERNPSIAEPQVAGVTLYLKGVTLHAQCASRDIEHSIRLCSDELARQVKRHREKRRRRREARGPQPQAAA